MRAVLAWSAFAAICVAAFGLTVLEESLERNRLGWFAHVSGVLVGLVSAGVGALLALRRPRNPIGWLLLANAALFTLSGFAFAWAAHALETPGTQPAARLAAVYDTSGWPPLFAGIVATALVFPDGRLPSPRWRPVAIGGAIAFATVLVIGMLWDEQLDAPFEGVEPYGVVSGPAVEAVHAAGLLGMILTFVLAMAALVRRFRGAEGVLRQQLKWIAYAAALIPIAIIAGTIEGALGGDDPGLATDLSFFAVQIAVPVSVGVAVLRYRLYEIDRIINATLVYGALTALLGAAFAAVSLGLGLALGGGSAFATAVATLAVAVAFRPLRERVQRAVDRRFNRARYEGLRRVDMFLEDLRLGRAEPEDVGAVLGEALSDPSLELVYWLPRDGVHADAQGSPVAELPAAPAVRTPVRRGALELGTLVHDPAALARPGLLDALIVRAGLAIEIARLRVEVRRRLAEVEQSRARIVTATYEERRRLERDLHDGAQQRLVSVGLELRHLQHELGADDGATRAAIDSAVGGLADAIAELRELARGVRPAALDGGLAPALRELASRSPIRTELEVTDERFAGEIEAAAYFVASEALTNAVKHAGGSRVVMRAEHAGGRLVVSVADDGRGGARPEPGSGLTGLADRVAALGGRLDLRSDDRTGTALVAEFPCAS